MIEYCAEKFAVFIKKRNDGIVSVPVLKFALIILINVLSIILIVLILGLLTHSLKNAALALFGFALLRFFSGGIHVKSAENCVFISVIIMSLIIYIPIHSQFEIFLQIVSLLLIIIFAPSYLESHIRLKKNLIPFLKMISILIVLSNFYWDSSILTKCFFIQSLLLIEFKRKGV